MYDTSFPLCVRRTHLTGSRVFHRAKQTYLLQTSSAWRKRKKRERESHSRSARYLPRLVNTLAVNSLNKLFPVREERPLCRGELESWKKNTRSNLCFENPCFLVTSTLTSTDRSKRFFTFRGKRRGELLCCFREARPILLQQRIEL